jgi:hypothetical protein
MKDFRVDYIPIRSFINSSVTTSLANQTVYLWNLIYNCTAAGTTWSFKVQDRTSPTPMVLYNIASQTVSTTPVVVINLNTPIAMIGGMDIITTGTPGTVLVWGAVSMN